MVHGVLSFGEQPAPDFQTTPVMDSWLGCLRGHSDRSALALSKEDAVAWQLPGPQGLCEY